MGAWALFMFHQGGGEAVVSYDTSEAKYLGFRVRHARLDGRSRQRRLDDR